MSTNQNQVEDPIKDQNSNASEIPDSYPNHNPFDRPSSASLPEPQLSATLDGTVSTLKRPRDEETTVDADEGSPTDAPASKRRVMAAHDLIYRIVVPSRQIGKVIGKAGNRIQKVREDSKATIKIADAISRNEERVIIISSKDSENIFSDAENALHQIVSLILKEDSNNEELVKVGAGHVAANTIRLLIADSQAGSLIGVSGQNIENLRNSSGATITVLSPSQLPPYASAHESDRVVQISGDIPVVLQAVVEIGCQLRENPPKQVISISPNYNANLHRHPHQCLDPNSAEYVNLELMVPENLVGGLIGRFGANISRIRNESGANIKVHGSRGEQTQRLILLGGSAQQVALAKHRVDEYMYAELMRQTGGQLLQAAVRPQQVPIQHSVLDISSTLYQVYGHNHGLYSSSNQQGGLIPSIYARPATIQSPYFGQQSCHTPPPPPPPPYL